MVIEIAPVKFVSKSETDRLKELMLTIIHLLEKGSVWIKLSGAKWSLPGEPALQAWARTFIELGGLSLLNDELTSQKPRGTIGQRAVALVSGLLEHVHSEELVSFNEGDLIDLRTKYGRPELVAISHSGMESVPGVIEVTDAGSIPQPQPVFRFGNLENITKLEIN